MKILIMTENERFSEHFTQVLTASGYSRDSILTFSDPMVAVSVPTRNRGCMILWDCCMSESPDRMQEELEKSDITNEWILLSDSPDEALLRRGLRMRASDVLALSTDRQEVQESIQRGIRHLRQMVQANLKIRAFRHMRFATVGQCMRGFLMHSVNDGDLDLMEELGLVPWRNRPGWMVLIHVVNRSENANVDRTMISTSVGNIVEELAEPFNEMRAMTWMSNDIYALFLQNRTETELEREQIMDILRQTRKCLEQYLNWKLNFYVAGPFLIEQSPQVWEELDECRKENVSLFPGVFHLDEWQGSSERSHNTHILDLRKFLSDGYPDLIEQESRQMLSQMVSKNAGRKQLRDFCQDYLKLVYSVMWENGWETNELIRTESDMEILNNAANTVADMERLIHHVSEYFSAKCVSRNTKSAVQLVSQYITDHYSEPLSRNMLAEYIHLNPDYLSRIFQKEMGCTLKEFIIRKRMEAARLLVRGTAIPISEIASMVGYENYPHFIQNYRKEFGITPKAERDNAKKDRS